MQRAKPYVEHIKQEQEICLRDVTRCETPPTMIQWLQPCFYRTKRKLKTDALAKPGFYLGPALGHPRDTHRILS